MNNLLQYGLAAAVTLLLLKEIFGFLVKMRAKNGYNPGLVDCAFAPHQQIILATLQDIRDGIRELVTLLKAGH